MKLGTIELPKGAALAPMAGVGDRAFREICRRWGAVWVVGEMVSSKGLHYNSPKTRELLTMSPAERPGAVQLFGDEPDLMAKAAVEALAYGPDAIDINMGCPAPKIAGGGSGSALMRRPELAGRIIRAVSDAVELPVTVKFRRGWDETSLNAVEIAKIAEENGAAAVAVHGRTRMQMYAPPVVLQSIAQVKQAVSIPVMGNGDVVDIDSAVEMYQQTGCDLVMIGRGAIGAPWVFQQIRHYFATGQRLPEPPLEQRLEVMLEHISLACAYKGEYVAMKEARKHLAHYVKGLRGAAGWRRISSGLATYEELKAMAAAIWEENKNEA